MVKQSYLVVVACLLITAASAAASNGEEQVNLFALDAGQAAVDDRVASGWTADEPLYAQTGARAEVEIDPGTGGRHGFFRGDRTFTLSGAGTASEDLDTNSFGFSSSYGYLLEDNLELGARLNGAFASPSNSSYQIGIAAAIDYHFPMMDGRLNPFVGALLGYNFGENTNDSFAAGPEGGVKYFVNDTTFLYGSLAYQWFFRSGGGADAFEDGSFSYAIGIGFKF